MTTPSNPSNLFSPFLPTTVNFPEEEDRVRTFLIDNFAQYADVINDKEIGTYLQTTEVFNGNKFFYDVVKTRNGYQALARIPQFPNTGTLTLTLDSFPQFPVPAINPQFVVSMVWGSASRPCSAIGKGDGDYFSFFGSGNPKITFTMSDTTIIITTTQDMTAYSGFIFVEYIRDGV